MPKKFDELKEKHRAERDNYPINLSLRVHRALSWLKRAEQADDLDARFIFLWISFNAAYAQEIISSTGYSEARAFEAFIGKLCKLEASTEHGGSSLENLVWSKFSGSIRVLLKNQYIFAPFWEFQKNKLTKEEWEKAFSLANAAANKAVSNRDTTSALSIVLSRIYTLRNQLIHGGATWNGGVNRDQINNCTDLMSELTPAIIEIMMNYPDALWGDPIWPVVS